MTELWVLIWCVGLQVCGPPNGNTGKLCSRWNGAFDYEIYTSSSLAVEKYDELKEKNEGKRIDYHLFQVKNEWLIAPKRKDILYDLKIINREKPK